MARKKGSANRRYTAEFKLEAIKLARQIGGNEAAMRLGMPESSLWNWMKAGSSAQLAKHTGHTHMHAAASAASVSMRKGREHAQALAQENVELKRQLADAHADLAILKKAAAYFARESK